MSDGDSEDMFKFKLGKWILLRDECVFMSLEGLGKDTSVHQYLLESIDNWVTKKEEFAIQEFVSEMCAFIKSENEDIVPFNGEMRSKRNKCGRGYI